MILDPIQPFSDSSGLFLSTSAGIAKLSSVSRLLGGHVKYVPPWKTFSPPPQNSLVLAWGNKATALRAQAYAKRHGCRLLRLEDGFLRSVGLGHQCEPLSIVVDDLGIYYDASRPSRLEHLICQSLTTAEHCRADALIQRWQNAAVSKYNCSPEPEHELPEQFVLIVDQTRNDASIRDGAATAQSFQLMLAKARQLYPDSQLVLKVHPDVWAGKKQGHFDLASLQQQGVLVLAKDMHPAFLLARASAVFCVTSQLGFEALLWQKPVFTFGMPFYAGWGLTSDALPAPARRTQVCLQQLVYAALVRYPLYLDPETAERCEVERLIDWFGLQRQMQKSLPDQLWAVGFSWWKQRLLKQFLAGKSLHFVARPQQVPTGSPWLCWGSRLSGPPQQIRIEDGFIRSVGLGVALRRPLSWVFDPVGIYYDSSAPSQLELILSQEQFSAEILQQAERLRTDLVSGGVTKYNLGSRQWRRPSRSPVILVPGQVETDASVRFGSPRLKTNLALLEEVRRQRPEAYLVYKPHPDVQAGLRKAGSAEQQALQYCDEVVLAEDMAHLLSQVDEVHTMTSLTGFEALLRGVPVFCYGQPFYAGWGLTTDWVPISRRCRRLQLTELIAGTLLRYPRYFHPVSGGDSTAQDVVAFLKANRSELEGTRTWWRPVLEAWLRLCKF